MFNYRTVLAATLLIAFGLSALGLPALAQDSQPSGDPDPVDLQKQAYQAYEVEAFVEAGKYFQLTAEAGYDAATNFYNAACSYSLAGEIDAGLDALNEAIDAGYTNYTNMSGDRDLESLRADPRFETTLNRIAHYRIKLTTAITESADEAAFVFDDAHNFVRAMQLVAEGAELIPTLEREYFAKASAGLKQMVTKYPFDVTSLAQAIEKYPERYERIEHNIAVLEAHVDQYRRAYAKLKEFAPMVVFPPTYFLVDRNRGIGSGSPDGQLITIERRTDESISRLEGLLVHELTHFQQLRATGPDEFYAIFGRKKSLLALTIREGAAVFFAEQVTGRTTKDDAIAYLSAHESELWDLFQEQMHSEKTGDWLWTKPADPDQPRDIAYALGSRIVTAYYRNATDKQQALNDILSVTDYELFLEHSGYAAQ